MTNRSSSAPTVVHRSHVTGTYCPDDTASVPHAVFTAANRYMANSLDAAVQPNEDGGTVYVNVLTANSYAPENTVLTVVIPPLPAPPPVPVPLPTPTPSGNPFPDGVARAHVEAANADAQATYKNEMAALASQVDQVRAQVRAQTDQLRNLQLPVEYAHTDIMGCLARAAERFRQGGTSERKLLVLATDLAENTALNHTGSVPPLVGVSVSLFLYCERAPACQSRLSTWRAVFTRAGVAPFDIHVFDTAQLGTLPPLLTLEAQSRGGGA